MYLQLSLLFCTTLMSGLLIFALPKKYVSSLDYILVLGGSYLFAITLVHMLPELFDGHGHGHGHSINLGLWLLIGFSLQTLLDLLGGSIAHGHVPGHSISAKKKSTSSTQRSVFTLLICLFFHASLEGALLTGDNPHLLVGMILHKMPIAFTLASVLLYRQYKRQNVLIILMIFAAITPLSALLKGYLTDTHILSATNALKLHAMAIGGVFHIATTILFETNPHHQLNKTKWVASLLGAALAVGIDYTVAH